MFKIQGYSYHIPAESAVVALGKTGLLSHVLLVGVVHGLMQNCSSK